MVGTNRDSEHGETGLTNDERSRRLGELTRDVTASYLAIGRMNRIGEENLPSRAAIIGLLEQLMALVFPGYYGAPVPAGADLASHVADRLEAAAGDLGGILVDILRFCHRSGSRCDELWTTVGGVDSVPAAPAGGGHYEPAARRLALDYLGHLPEIRHLLDQDVRAAFEGDPAASSFEEIILCYPGVLAVTVHRLAHPLYLMGIPLLPRIMSEWAHQRSGIDIHPGARIGVRFFIDHGTGVVVGETTRIGQGVKIYQGVTLGALSFPRNPDGTLVKGGRRHPTIGDGVTIYANATILGGNTTVGDGAVIGGGVWITSSVPAGAKVLS